MRGWASRPEQAVQADGRLTFVSSEPDFEQGREWSVWCWVVRQPGS